MADVVTGVQLCGSRPHQLIPAAEAVLGACPDVDFIDINCGCPIDLVVSFSTDTIKVGILTSI